MTRWRHLGSFPASAPLGVCPPRLLPHQLHRRRAPGIASRQVAGVRQISAHQRPRPLKLSRQRFGVRQFGARARRADDAEHLGVGQRRLALTPLR